MGQSTDATRASASLRPLAGEPRRRYLEAAVRRVVASLAALPSGEASQTGLALEVDVAGARYRLRGSFAGAGLFEAHETIVVLLERVAGTISADLLSSRYRLTHREIDVARLIARGLTNLELSAELGISRHTVKRHTERVLHKLGVRSRAAAAAHLLGDGASVEPRSRGLK